MTRHYSVTEIARLTGVSPQYIRFCIKQGRIAAKKIGGVWIIKKEEKERLVRRKQILLRYRENKLRKEALEEDSGEITSTNYILPSINP